MNDVPDFLRAMVRRNRDAADAAPLATEVRTEGSVVFRAQPSGPFAAAVPDVAVWEWTYGLPEDRIDPLIKWLQENEQDIVDRMKQVLDPEGAGNQLIRYRGTFITVTADRGWYEVRTRWGYIGASPVVQWPTLLADEQFLGRFKHLRGIWAADQSAKEQLHCLLQFYSYPDDFAGYGTAAEKEAVKKILEATRQTRRR